jgi:ankyrin repeat protein
MHRDLDAQHAQIHTHTGTHARVRTHTRRQSHLSTARCRVWASVSHCRWTSLHKTAHNGHAAAAAALLTHGADMNAKNNDGCGSRSLFSETVGAGSTALPERDGIDASRSGFTHT